MFSFPKIALDSKMFIDREHLTPELHAVSQALGRLNAPDNFTGCGLAPNPSKCLLADTDIPKMSHLSLQFSMKELNGLVYEGELPNQYYSKFKLLTPQYYEIGRAAKPVIDAANIMLDKEMDYVLLNMSNSDRDSGILHFDAGFTHTIVGCFLRPPTIAMDISQLESFWVNGENIYVECQKLYKKSKKQGFLLKDEQAKLDGLFAACPTIDVQNNSLIVMRSLPSEFTKYDFSLLPEEYAKKLDKRLRTGSVPCLHQEPAYSGPAYSFVARYT